MGTLLDILFVGILFYGFHAHAIFGGMEIQNSDLIQKSVVALSSEKMVSSAVIIGDQLLLTAGHNTITEKTKVFFGNDLSQSPHALRKILKIIRHPSFQIPDPVSGQVIGIDLAIILLDEKIPTGFEKVALQFSNAASGATKSLWIAGYGKTDLDRPAWPSRLKKAELAIQSLQDPKFIYLRQETVSAGACSGDSGGPAYSIENNQIQVWGLLHATTGMCLGSSLYTKLEFAKDWIINTALALDSEFKN